MKQKAGVSELLRAYGTIFAGILIVIAVSYTHLTLPTT